MNKGFNSKEKFACFSLNSHYLRVDDEHPLELRVGLNDNGDKTLSFVGDFVPAKVRGSKVVDLKHFSNNGKVIVNFSLIDPAYEDLFYLFCNDVVDLGRTSHQPGGYEFILNRFEKWKGFGLSNRGTMSEHSIRGLLGELLFLLEVMVPRFGISNAILSWTGPDPAKKDFSYNDTWNEVKTYSKDTVTISSIDQLDSDQTGHLELYMFEKMSPTANQLSLKTVCDRILEHVVLETDKSLFMIKIANIGYCLEEYYDSFVYRLISHNSFIVDDNFPRLRRENLPTAIADLRYDLLVNSLEKYKEQ